ncbi:MAG: asparagine synthase (glutamine-hydrolyzing) [Candidatus Melainabacteria bacterium]|nr:asparagine synthase (glutamine-hydrolyzing) [Candidatus Melainabacteria bacterium]
MCGIVGIIGSSTIESDFNEITDLLQHRGPDDRGTVVLDKKVFLGHRRLSVIDLSLNARQPMSNEDKSIWITYNGEVYNFLELRRNLQDIGCKFKSKSDTEVILKLYETKGESCVNDLNGMFAFAVYDSRKNQIFIARDRLGIKPLYYANYNGNLVFASEIKAILATNLIPKEINWQSVYNYFSFSFVPNPATAFKNIKQLPPAHYLTFNLVKNELNIQKYWEPFSEIKNNYSYFELKERLRFYLEDSVKMQLVSDVPLGVFLSGGIDSTILAALATKHSLKKLKTFTVTFPQEELVQYDESKRAKYVSEFFNSEHLELPVESTKSEEITELISCFDQPFGNPTFYLSYLISKLTKEHVTVTLTGVGGDELFGGYSRYKVLRFAKLINSFPDLFTNVALKMCDLIPREKFSPLLRRMKLLFSSFGSSFSKQYMMWSYYFSDLEKSKLFLPSFSQNKIIKPSISLINNYLNHSKDLNVINSIEYLDLNMFLVDNLLEYTDKTTMAFGLESRVPFLDHRIVELSLAIPGKYKVSSLNSKIILKDTFSDLLPSSIKKMPKKGFSAPIYIWIEKYFDFYFEKILSKSYLDKQGIINWDYVQALRREHKCKKDDNSMKLFSIIMFDVWYKKYFS